MNDFVTLSCPTCGGSLQITADIERFACGYCGNEHIVRRSGGIVSLSPVVAEIRKVGVGVDATAAELAIVRIDKEINRIQALTCPFPNDSGLPWLGAFLIVLPIVAVPFLVCSGLLSFPACALIALISLGSGFWLWHLANLKDAEANEEAWRTFRRSIDDQMAPLLAERDEYLAKIRSHKTLNE